ncbi:MAG: acetyl-coenzyme A synthetase N-terminal domain-containing protein, partial [Porticoccus sp.]
MSQVQVHPVPESFAQDAHINADTYQEMYRRSIEDADNFWSEQAEKFIDWEQPWSNVSSFDFNSGDASWFSGGKLNVSVNCIDRHLATRGEQTAIIWEGDDPG